MKITLEIPHALFRKAKTGAALEGKGLKRFVADAVKEKLARPSRNRSRGWQAVFGKLPAKAAREMRAITTDSEFRKIESENSR